MAGTRAVTACLLTRATLTAGAGAGLRDSGERGHIQLLAARPGVDLGRHAGPPRPPAASRPSPPGPRAGSCAAGRRPRRRRRRPPSREAVVCGGSRRTSETRPESTRGAGQNTVRPTEPARRTSAYHRALTLGTPYVREPGSAASRSATSACTMTSTRCSEGKRSSRCSSTGTETLYGRLATSAVGGGPGSASIRSASAATTSSRSAYSGANAATVAGSSAARTGSISTATTRRTSGSSARVSEPSPGPTSITTSSAPTPAVRTILRTVLPSTTKFWPSVLVGRTDSRAARARTSAAPSRRATSDQLNRREPQVPHGEAPRAMYSSCAR